MTQADPSWRAVHRPGIASSYFDAAPLPPLEPEARGFHAGNAWWLAELCRLLYRRDADESPRARPPGRGAFLERVGLREVRAFDPGAVRCALFGPADRTRGRFAALVFRGTLGWPDIRADAEAVPVRWERGGRVHRGFRRVLDRVWGEVERALGDVEGPVLYAGHSLGGALAAMAASRRAPDGLYTFGAPRPGNEGFGRTLEGVRAHRVVNGRDVCTALPPRGWPGRFRHVGEAVRLARPAAGIERRWNDPPPCFADHAPVNYVAAIERELLARGAAAS